MTWWGINNFGEPAIWPSKAQPGGSMECKTPECGELFVRGSILLEAEIHHLAGSDQVLLDYSFNQGWQRSLKICLTAAGDLLVDIKQGLSHSRGRLENVLSSSGSLFRLTLSWDGPQRFGVVSLENLDDDSILQASLTTPVPIPVDDLERIIKLSGPPEIDPSVSLIAISDQVEKVGLNPSIARGSLIKTTDGRSPIERLGPGDVVLTDSNQYQPIRWIVERTVPAYGSFAPIRLRAPYMCLTKDIFVAPHQKMVMKGTSAEYLFGQESVMVKARDLLGHPSACLAAGQQTTTYYQIILDQHQNIEIGGAWGASQFVGGFETSPSFNATNPLADLPESAKPRHQFPTRTVLQSHETTSLLSSISA